MSDAPFVPHHRLVTAKGSEPDAWLLMLHGMFGSGPNWHTFARTLCAARPDWGAVLVDLRMHGQSTDAPGPHSVRAAAADLLALQDQLGHAGHAVRAVLGHSFGGKVALVYQHLVAERGAGPLAQTWVIDASPSARPEAMTDADNTVVRVLHMLRDLPASFPDRDAFVAAVRARGFAEPLARWLSMNLERRADGYVSRLDAGALESLLRDYYELDAWPMVEDFVDAPGRRASGQLAVVIAGRGSALGPDDRARFAGLAAAGENILVSTIERAGHWVHVDAPDELLELVSAHLPAV